MNPAQPPEGILDPQQPYWPANKVGEITWLRLKGKLTGRRVEGLSENFSSYVKLGDADADRLIANIKKWGKYPTVNQNDKYGGALNNEAYQKWLVEEFLEKPFREETDKKIEEAQTESRINEIRDKAKKDKESVPLPAITPKEDEEQEELDQDQEELVDKIDNLTEDIDSMDDDSENNSEKKESTEPEKTDDEEPQNNNDFSDIKDSLEQIKGSLQIQASDLASINQNDAGSIGALEGLKQLFQTQNDILRKQVENAKKQAEESSLEKSQQTSGTSKATDLTADNKAEGIIQGIDGEVITVKTTEGQFRQGEKISQGDGGGGLFGMLKGIAGKFLSKGGGGGGSPIKMSGGGFLNTAYPAMAEGGLTPGVYNKPTRGNLLPGQAVIPLNRNVGKKLLNDGGRKNTQKFDQPLVDVMSQPLKAIGLSIISVAGNFIKSLGPLGGFFLPFAKGLVKGFATVLGVPATMVMSLLGGPAYAAMDQQDKQQNIFVKLWGDLMKKFGFDLGGEDEKDKKNKKKSPPSSSGGGMIPGDAPPEIKAMLEAISAGEGSWDSVNPSTTVEGLSGMTIADARRAAIQKGKIEKGGSGAMGKWQQMPQFIIERAKSAGLNPDKDIFNEENQTKIARMLMAGVYPGGERQLVADAKTDPLRAASNLRGTWPSLPGGSQENTSKEKFLANFKKSTEKYSAEDGVQIKVNEEPSMGKFMGWQILDGPVGGYKVSDNLEMHGKEAYLQHENAFTVLPIENNKYSLSKNPAATLDRWKEILGPNNTVNVGDKYEDGGTKVFDPKKFKGDAQSSRYIPVGQGNNSKSYSIMYDREGASGTYTIKAISKKVSGNIISGDNLTSVEPNSKEWAAVLNSSNVKEYFKTVPGGGLRKGLKLELKSDKDSDIYYGYNQAFQTTKNAWIKKGVSQEDANKYAAAAAKEFAISRKSGSWLPGSRNGLDPSLKEVEVSSGDTSSSSSSGEPDNDFALMEKAFSAMIVGAGIMAAQPKNKEEYDTLKAEFESAFKVTTPTTVTADSNSPAPQQTLTAQPSPSPAIASAHSANAVTSSETLTQPTMQEQLCQWSAIYYA